MKNNKLVFIICMMLIIISIPISMATPERDSLNVSSVPNLEVKIMSGVDILTIHFTVENIGDTTVHDVKLIDMTVEGNVLYNSRIWMVSSELDPGQKAHYSTDMILGFGRFTVNLTVTCEEGDPIITSANGFIFGFIYIIP